MAVIRCLCRCCDQFFVDFHTLFSLNITAQQEKLLTTILKMLLKNLNNNAEREHSKFYGAMCVLGEYKTDQQSEEKNNKKERKKKTRCRVGVRFETNNVFCDVQHMRSRSRRCRAHTTKQNKLKSVFPYKMAIILSFAFPTEFLKRV